MAVWPDDKHLATWQGQVRSTTFGFMYQTINLLNLDGGKGRRFSMPSVPVPAYGLAFSSDGKFIATGTVKGAVTLWSLPGIESGK